MTKNKIQTQQIKTEQWAMRRTEDQSEIRTTHTTEE